MNFFERNKKIHKKKDKTQQISNQSNGLREKILMPDKVTPKNDAKTKVLILKLSYDVGSQRDLATDYKKTKQLVSERGYTVINSGEIIYDVDTGKLNTSEIISSNLSKNLKGPFTIWLEAHSSPGWIFGSNDDFETEANAALLFRNCLVAIENETGLHAYSSEIDWSFQLKAIARSSFIRLKIPVVSD